MGFALLALGMVLVVEGLVVALAPARLDALLRALAEIPVGRRRVIGLAALAAGIVLCRLALSLGAG